MKVKILLLIALLAASLAVASPAGATPTPPVIVVNHSTGQCAEVIQGDDCTWCEPLEGWEVLGYSSGTTCPDGYEDLGYQGMTGQCRGYESQFCTSDPVIDVWEMEKEIVVEGEMPGVSSKDFSLVLDRGRLILEGYKREPRYINCQKFYRMEREFGFFKRVIELPASVDTSGIEASLVDGLLVVRLPKITEKRKRSITIPVSE